MTITPEQVRQQEAQAAQQKAVAAAQAAGGVEIGPGAQLKLLTQRVAKLEFLARGLDNRLHALDLACHRELSRLAHLQETTNVYLAHLEGLLAKATPIETHQVEAMHRRIRKTMKAKLDADTAQRETAPTLKFTPTPTKEDPNGNDDQDANPEA